MTTSGLHPETASEPGTGLIMPGLDGTNPLGFLAALGLFRVLDDAPSLTGLKLGWIPAGGTWVPRLRTTTAPDLDQAGVLATLEQRLVTSISDHPSNIFEELGAVSGDRDRRRKLIQTIASGTDRRRMEWTASFASDFATPESINQLQTTRRDYFYGNVKSVIGRTRSEHLRRAIFQPWDYADALDNQSLHLDPSEDRRHAYQWSTPAGDPARKSRGGMLGANRLALEAIPLFPSFPEAGTLRTVGFTGNRSTNTRWTWPIWKAGLALPVVRSLLALEFLQADIPESPGLKAMGIVAAYRTRRILVGKTPNFTPAQRIA